MIKFSKDKVKLLHQLISEETGGSIGVRDEGLLESALEGVFERLTVKTCIPRKRKKARGLVIR